MKRSSGSLDPPPVVFACAGCSPVARLSWEVAKELDRRGAAEMSRLAGVGARRPSFLKQTRERPVWVVDGCPIVCGLGVLQPVGKPVDWHIRLDLFGFRKHDDHSTVAVAEPVDRTLASTARRRPAPAPHLLCDPSSVAPIPQR